MARLTYKAAHIITGRGTVVVAEIVEGIPKRHERVLIGAREFPCRGVEWFNIGRELRPGDTVGIVLGRVFDLREIPEGEDITTCL
jgi:hypothetical protein